MIEIIALISRFFLAAIFAVSGISKIKDSIGTRQTIKDFGIPAFLNKPLSLLLPLIELLTVLLLIFDITIYWGGILSSLLLIAFIIVIGKIIKEGKVVDCHCFGQVHSAPTGWNTIYRNIGLLILSILVIIQGYETENGYNLLDTTRDQWIFALLMSIILYQGFLVVKLLDWQVTAKKNIEDLEDVAFSGLPVGTKAPIFELANHQEKKVGLQDLLAYKKPVLLFFTSPNCPVCASMMPYAIEWHNTHKDKITLVFMSFKGEKTKPLEEIDDVHFLVPRDGKVPLELYKTREVPTVVHITPLGRIGSRPANGGLNIENLIKKLVAA